MNNLSTIDISYIDPTPSGANIFDAAAMLNDMRNESYALFRAAVDDIKIIRREYITVCATSFGKDSTVTLLAALNAHIELMEEGVLTSEDPFVASHIDTGVESHLMLMLCSQEIKALKQYCKQKNINLDMRVGYPPLQKQWSSLFVSGQKLVSSARSNSDCAQLLKVDNAAALEKSIEHTYKGLVVTLLGSRISESIRRGSNMRKRGTDKVTANDLVQGKSSDERVFAPIMTMSDSDVWNIIRGAGLFPIEYMGFTIESYTYHHRLLNIIYKDSEDGACQYSAKKIKGEKAKVGGCAGSPRSGCNLCAKSVTDKSGEQLVKKPRHAVISGNILKVRNYLMYVAQDIKYRTYHSRAVDHTTRAIALQPNTLRAEVLDKLIFLLTQATFDDFNRAQTFKALVEQGEEMQDVGYRDIMTDSELDEEDRKALAKAYLEHAQTHLIKPMSIEIAIYISAIHARDGIRLPPHRAIHIWNEVSKGARIPYPDIDPATAVISDIPDAIMVVPTDNIPLPSLHEFNFLSLNDAQDCEVSLKKAQISMPVRDAKYFVGDNDTHHLAGLKNTDTIDLRGISSVQWTSKLRTSPLNKPIAKRFSKRPIKKVSRKGGGFVVTERGRTSLDNPSFSLRTSTPHLANTMTSSIPLYLNDRGHEEALNLDEDIDAMSGYDIDMDSFYDWLQFAVLNLLWLCMTRLLSLAGPATITFTTTVVWAHSNIMLDTVF